MNSSSLKDLPLELWEYILDEAIKFDGNIALQTTCSPVTYMAFKASSRAVFDNPGMVLYKKIEIIRRKLRLVCRAWNLFVDNWKYRDRWIRIAPGSVARTPNCQYLRWNTSLRLEFRFNSADLELGSNATPRLA